MSKRNKEKTDPAADSEVAYNTKNLSEAVLSEIKQILGHTNINAIEYEAESPDEQALVEVTGNSILHHFVSSMTAKKEVHDYRSYLHVLLQ